jgi:sterol desaturase/sphingolipid hydroxylase (fatty acid hydroxylase superfamily)
MNNDGNPTPLRIVAGMFIFSGICIAADIVISLFHGNVNINLGILSLWIGPGLLKHNRGWRDWALIFLWFGIIGAPVLLFIACVYDMDSTQTKILGIQIGNIPNALIFVYIAAIFLLDIWQYRVLTRPDIKALFKSN